MYSKPIYWDSWHWARRKIWDLPHRYKNKIPEYTFARGLLCISSYDVAYTRVIA